MIVEPDYVEGRAPSEVERSSPTSGVVILGAILSLGIREHILLLTRDVRLYTLVSYSRSRAYLLN